MLNQLERCGREGNPWHKWPARALKNQAGPLFKSVTISLVALFALSILPVALGPETARIDQSENPLRDALLGISVDHSEFERLDWFTSAVAQLEQQEYSVTWQERPNKLDMVAGYQAPNRAQDLRTYFYPEGIRVVPRTEVTPMWVFGLDLARFGRAETLRSVPEALLAPDANRIEYDRGDVTEWFENRPEGLKHGFTLTKPPEGTGDVVIEAILSGDLVPRLVTNGKAVDFVVKKGNPRVLRYDSLSVFDANRRELPARLELDEDRLHILFTDEAAEYPLTVDPLMTSPSWTAEGNQDGAGFGWSVAAAGDANGDGYDDVIVGAPRYDDTLTDEGKVFVYHGSASGLSVLPNWTAVGGQASSDFGQAVFRAGDVNNDGFGDVIIGARYYDDTTGDEGRVSVYHGSSSGLSPTENWSAVGGIAGAHFGNAVSTAGDVNGDGYDDIIVAAAQCDNPENQEGMVFVYHGSASGLPPLPNWTAEGNRTKVFLGWSVAPAGDVNNDTYDDIIVGAIGHSNGQSNEGGAFVFHGSGSGLSAGADWTAESDQGDAWFGNAVSTGGDVNGDGFADVIVGANRYTNGNSSEGAAFLYLGSATGLSPTANWTAEGNQDLANYGRWVSTAGDVNGDGYDDVIVGASWFDNDEEDEGRAFVYHGSAAGLSPIATWTAEADLPSAMMGRSVSTAGDVNNDSFDDVIVGARWYFNLEVDEGRAFLYLGGSSVPEVVVVESGGSTDIAEGGLSDTYTVVLMTQPVDNVTITPNPDGQLTVFPPVLNFTLSNWNSPQIVTVIAVNDSIAEGLHTGNITHSASSPDSAYDGIAVMDVTVAITDNDVAGVTITPTAVSVAEGGASDSYTVVLTSEPTADVTILVIQDSQVTALPSPLTFTPGSWDTPQTVFVTAVDDSAIEGTHLGTITHTSSSLDTLYNNIVIVDITASITDNDFATVPSAPQNLQATAGNGQVDLAWLEPASDGGSIVTNYRIYRGTTSGSLSFLVEIGAVLSHTDDTVTNDITHYYEVSAVNAVGEGPHSNEASATPTGPANSPPTAAFEISPPTAEVGENVTFNASSSSDPDGIIVSFAWDFGDGETGTGEVVNHEYGAPGTYNITLAVTDDGGLHDNATLQLVVTAVTDSTKPVIVISEPADGSTLNMTTVAVTGTAWDDVAVEKVEISPDGTNWMLATGTTNWSTTLTLAEGSNQIYARATDTSGNEATVSTTIIVEIPPTGGGGIVSEVWPWTAILVILVAIAMASALLFTDRGRFTLLKFFLLPLYIKLKKGEVLDNFLRGQIYAYILMNPGDRYTNIKRYLGLKNGPLLYHLDVLEREGLISSRKAGANKLFYPKGSKMVDDGLHTVQRMIMDRVGETPGVSASDLGALIGVSRQLINYHVIQLAGKGLVVVERRGVRNRFYLSD